MKNILLMIDMQYGFLQHEQTKKLANRIHDILKKNIFDIICATRFINTSGSVYEKLLNWKKMTTIDEQQIPIEYHPYINYVFNKTTYNCVDIDFLQKLTHLNDNILPTQIFIVGVDTDCCVLTIATSLFEHNIRPIVLTHYCNSNGGVNSHNAGLLCMKRLIGAKQMFTKEISTKEDLAL